MKSCDEAATQRDRERRLRGSAACDEKDEDTATGEMASWPLPSCWARLVWGSAEADGLLASFFPVFWSVRLAYLLTRVWQGYFVPLCVDFCRPLHLRQQLVLFLWGWREFSCGWKLRLVGVCGAGLDLPRHGCPRNLSFLRHAVRHPPMSSQSNWSTSLRHVI